MHFRSASIAGSARTRSFLSALALLVIATAPTTSAAQALALAEAVRVATQGAPSLSAQDASIRAARETGTAAAELPDPKLILGIENLPVDGADRFSTTRDSMTMRKVGLMQEFPSGEKRGLRGERASAEVRRETALREAAAANLRRDTALAWIDAWFAERQWALLQDLERESRLAVSAAQAALAGGKGQATDAIAARQALAQIGDRMIEARRGIDRARAQLARWIGTAAERPLGDAPDFSRLAHEHQSLVGDLENHPHLAMYGAMEAMAQAEVKLADAARRPDWSLEVMYQQRGDLYSNMMSFNVRIDLPIFEAKRQSPMIAARVAAAEQVRAQAEDARRSHLADIRTWMTDWHAALERSKRFEAEQVPLARERSEVSLAAYRGGKAEIAVTLEARRNEIETRLAQLQAGAEAARAWAQLNFLLPDASQKEPS